MESRELEPVARNQPYLVCYNLTTEIDEEDIMEEEEEEELEFRSAFCCLRWSNSRSRRCSVAERSLLHHDENGTPVAKFRLSNQTKDEKQRPVGPAAGRRWRSFIRQLEARGRDPCRLTKSTQFRYDPRSHALNFEGSFERELDASYAGFADRFAPRPPLRALLKPI